MTEINVLEHELVPEHKLLTPEEAKEMLADLNLTPDKLPKIKVHDPCIRVLEMASGKEIIKGSLIRIIRPSPTAGSTIGYRMVVI